MAKLIPNLDINHDDKIQAGKKLINSGNLGRLSQRFPLLACPWSAPKKVADVSIDQVAMVLAD